MLAKNLTSKHPSPKTLKKPAPPPHYPPDPSRVRKRSCQTGHLIPLKKGPRNLKQATLTPKEMETPIPMDVISTTTEAPQVRSFLKANHKGKKKISYASTVAPSLEKETISLFESGTMWCPPKTYEDHLLEL
jgi:hypothetical protein